MSKINIEFNIEEQEWLQYDKNIEKNLSEFLIEIIKYTKLKDVLELAQIEISILLTNNNKIRELNKNYRQKDGATNILSFPLHDIDLRKNLDILEHLLGENLILGDLVLSLEYLQKEAMDQGKKIEYHLKHLLLHGLLHLIGYDHMLQEEREEMESLEIEILSKLGIENPYYIDGI